MRPRPSGFRRRPRVAGSEAGAGLLGSLFEVVGMVVLAALLALLVQEFVIKPFYIPSASMEPTLQEGDRVMVSRFIYRFTDPDRGDIVVFHPPTDPDIDYIKRVVAVEGDTVSVEEGHLIVNGEVVDEPYLKDQMIDRPFEQNGPIPEHQVFVMGDNRNASGDSRVFGPVDEDEILGQAFLVYWPLDRLGIP